VEPDARIAYLSENNVNQTLIEYGGLWLTREATFHGTAGLSDVRELAAKVYIADTKCFGVLRYSIALVCGVIHHCVSKLTETQASTISQGSPLTSIFH
jgi:hypothetical protein